jgi:hypothetical protein
LLLQSLLNKKPNTLTVPFQVALNKSLKLFFECGVA